MGWGIAGHIGAAGAVHGDGLTPVPVVAAQIGGVGQEITRRVELGHEGVVIAIVEGFVVSPGGGGITPGAGPPGHVGVLGAVQSDAFSAIPIDPTRVGGVGKGASRGVQLGDEDIPPAVVGRIIRPARGGIVR
ncbi:hypothetical protein ES703_103777 [subsurface metagenome]